MSFNITITEIIDNVEVSSDQGTPITLEYNATIVQGAQGYTGSAGSLGTQGYTGSEGVGYTGSQGIPGTQGTQGNIGYTGSDGIQGITGFTGSKGDSGFTGSQGIQGYNGSQGNKAGFIYKFSTDTGMVDPGAGYFRINTGTNKIAISRINADGSDMGDQSSDFIPIGSTIYLVSNTNGQSTYLKVDVQLIVVKITGGQVAWYEITYINRTAQGNFANDEFMALQVTERGYTGSQGVGFTGSQGATGFVGSKGDIGYTGSYGPVDLIRATNDTASATLYPVMVGASGSDQTAKVTTNKLEFNAATGVFKVTGEIIAEKLTIQYTTVTTTDIVTDDVFTILNNTNATNTGTGALVVAGGVGIAQDVFIGGQTNVSGHIIPTANAAYDLGSSSARFKTLYVTSSTIDIGGATISVSPEGYIDVDKIELTDTTESTSTQTGALVVYGGAGIGKNLHVAGEIIRNGISIGYGYTGSQGDIGYSGSQGVQGETGFVGSRGDLGYTGSEGKGYALTWTNNGVAISNSGQFVFGHLTNYGAYQIGQRIRVGADLNGTNWMEGVIYNIDSVYVYFESDSSNGSGTYSTWYPTVVGLKGQTGFSGSKGDTGFVGSQGFTGSKGDQGFTGSQGATGFVGSKGDLGYTGSAGSYDQDLNTTNSPTFNNITVNRIVALTTATNTQYNTYYSNNSANFEKRISNIDSTATLTVLTIPGTYQTVKLLIQGYDTDRGFIHSQEMFLNTISGNINHVTYAQLFSDSSLGSFTASINGSNNIDIIYNPAVDIVNVNLTLLAQGLSI